MYSTGCVTRMQITEKVRKINPHLDLCIDVSVCACYLFENRF